MKKLLLIAAIAVLGANVNAQEVRFGAKAGYSYSTLKMKEDGKSETSDPLHTFYVGGLVEYKLSDKFALQGELLYSPLGGKMKIQAADPQDPTTFLNFKAKRTLHTLLIPVSAKYFITEGLSVSAGANVGLILSAKEKLTADLGLGPLVELEGDQEVDIKDQVNALNLAPFLGAEYALENGLFFDARYNLGVSNLAKHAEGNGKLTNSFIQVGVGFKFGGN
ncbi:porin family protein [Chryseobacterium sp. PMSZPI]|uniref:porin family protein n=1 Tax=Chryseobacterium sp. PMSZPI TaxID=1033900 RepID=UPI000C31E238|nr:porin family protein [Chryseobacterium sp. PMSZPI]PKF75900.1 PorT family protein [Chryseobacterium sp. PMSZPI]